MEKESKNPKEQTNNFKKEPLKRVQIIAQSYYSRKDIQQAIFDFCKNRETVPRYLDGFGKRPDMLDYPNDILNYAKKGATSFHCSEELWGNPLSISTEKNQAQLNELKIGWDFLIDIDSKYLDYSKIAAKLIVKALEYHGVKNIGLKFSGSKGFHLIVPWKAFPEEISGIKTKDMFPEWPRIVAEYIDEMIHDNLVKEVFQLSNQNKLNQEDIFEIKCTICNNEVKTQKISNYVCGNCKAQMQSTKAIRKVLRCPSCNFDMTRVSKDEIYVCETCKTNSRKNPEQFEKKPTTKTLIDSVDIVLVSSRHLFRAPYSLHEKTSLASAVLKKEEIENFNPIDADPLKIKVRNFDPNPEQDEARELLLQALDWAKKKNKIKKEFTGKSIDMKGLKITEEMFPECIKNALQGMKQDGRKRALSLLLSFFSTLQLPQNYIETAIDKWNKKNHQLLQEGYIQSQINWYIKNPRMPPNYDKPIYKELGILGDTKALKNPINYTIREAMRAKSYPSSKQQKDQNGKKSHS